MGWHSNAGHSESISTDSKAWAWAVVNVAGIISKTVLVAEYDVEPERLKDWVGLEIKKKKSNSL